MGDGPHRCSHVVPQYRGSWRSFLPTRQVRAEPLHFFAAFFTNLITRLGSFLFLHSQIVSETVSIFTTSLH